jgi:DHA2 family multidrug resistance protein
VHDRADQQKPSRIDYQGIAFLAISVAALQYVLEFGQRDDWFDSHTIITLSVIGAIGGIVLLWRELTTDTPVIDFRIMKHRQMWVGTTLGVVMGIGLYAMSFTLPVFLQANLRMTAEQAGIAMLPGAIATAISMAVVGRLTNRFDPRILITIGALVFALAAWDLSKMTALSGAGDFFWPLIYRGVGLGLMFVPLTTVTLAELAPQEMAQGAGLYNFFRQLGGSFGIAGIATLLARYTTQLRSVLGDHLVAGDPNTMARVNGLTAGMVAKGADPWTAKQRALSLIDAQLVGQASILAYSKIYVISAGLILLLIPLLLLIRQTKGSGGADHSIME